MGDDAGTGIGGLSAGEGIGGGLRTDAGTGGCNVAPEVDGIITGVETGPLGGGIEEKGEAEEGWEGNTAGGAKFAGGGLLVTSVGIFGWEGTEATAGGQLAASEDMFSAEEAEAMGVAETTG